MYLLDDDNILQELHLLNVTLSQWSAQVVYKQTEARGFEGRPNAVSSALFVVLVQPMR